MPVIVTAYGTWDVPAAWDGGNGLDFREVEQVNGVSIVRLYAPAYALLLETRDVRDSIGASVFQGTTSTELTIGTGEQTFVTGGGKAFGAGATLRVVDASDASRFITGTSIGYDTETGECTLVVSGTDPKAGSGTITGANVSLVGAPGAAVLSGSAVGPVDMAGQPLTAHLITHKTGTEHLPSATSTPTAVSGAQSVTLVSYSTHWLVVDGDTTFTVTPGTTAGHLTECLVTIQSDGGAWAVTFAGATEAQGEVVNTTGMTDGQKVNFVFYQGGDGTVLYRQAGGYFS